MQIRHAIHFQLSAFNYLIKGIDDTLEVRNLQGSTTNQTAVNIRVGKQFLCIRRLTAATIKDRAVVSNFLTILFSNKERMKAIGVSLLVLQVAVLPVPIAQTGS